MSSEIAWEITVLLCDKIPVTYEDIPKISGKTKRKYLGRSRVIWYLEQGSVLTFTNWNTAVCVDSYK